MSGDKKQRDSFVFYRSFYDVIKTLDPESKINLLDMICELGLNRQTEPPANKLTEQLFMLIRPQIDANYRKAIGGKKGGRPSKETAKKEETEGNKPMVKPMVFSMVKPMGKPNVNGNVNVNVNEYTLPSEENNIYNEEIEYDPDHPFGAGL